MLHQEQKFCTKYSHTVAYTFQMLYVRSIYFWRIILLRILQNLCYY